MEPTQQAKKEKAPYPRKTKLYRWRHSLCPGLRIPTDKDCAMCGINLHSLCIAEANREISDVDSNAVKNSYLCSAICCRFSKIDGLTAEAVKLE
jgi:hypothetical protein